MTNNLLLKDNKLISSSDVLYKWSAGNKLARAYSTDVWDKPLVGGRLSEIGLYPRVFDTYKWLVENGLYDNLVFGINRQAGFLPNEITGADHLHTAYDLSKYNNDAVQATAADQPKIVSKAWEFDRAGSNEIKTANDNVNNNLGYSFSVCFKINLKTINTHFFINQSGITGWAIGVHPTAGFRVYTGSLSASWGKGSNYFDANKWYYVIMTYNNDREEYVQVFVDGTKLTPSTIYNQNYTPSTDSINIGGKWSNSWDYLDAYIGNAVIFNKVLTPEEITATTNHFKYI